MAGSSALPTTTTRRASSPKHRLIPPAARSEGGIAVLKTAIVKRWWADAYSQLRCLTVKKGAPPFAFFFLHLCTAWPVGVVGLALASSLVKAGVSVHHAAGIIAAASLAFTIEFIWGPMVDACLSRRHWYVGGAAVMCVCLVALLIAPWDAASVPLMTAVAFISCSGAAIAAVAVKGLMAYEVPTAKIGTASGFYTAGGIVAKAVGGAGTL